MAVSKKNESTQAAVDKVDKGGSRAVARNLETRPVGRAHHDQPQRLCCSSVTFAKTSSGLLLTKYQWKVDPLISSTSVCFAADL